MIHLLYDVCTNCVLNGSSLTTCAWISYGIHNSFLKTIRGRRWNYY